MRLNDQTTVAVKSPCNYGAITLQVALATTQVWICPRGSLFCKRNTLVTFEMKVNAVLMKLGEFSVALIDDIAVYSQTWEDYVEHVKHGFG